MKKTIVIIIILFLKAILFPSVSFAQDCSEGSLPCVSQGSSLCTINYLRSDTGNLIKGPVDTDQTVPRSDIGNYSNSMDINMKITGVDTRQSFDIYIDNTKVTIPYNSFIVDTNNDIIDKILLHKPLSGAFGNYYYKYNWYGVQGLHRIKFVIHNNHIDTPFCTINYLVSPPSPAPTAVPTNTPTPPIPSYSNCSLSIGPTRITPQELIAGTTVRISGSVYMNGSFYQQLKTKYDPNNTMTKTEFNKFLVEQILDFKFSVYNKTIGESFTTPDNIFTEDMGSSNTITLVAALNITTDYFAEGFIYSFNTVIDDTRDVYLRPPITCRTNGDLTIGDPIPLIPTPTPTKTQEQEEEAENKVKLRKICDLLPHTIKEDNGTTTAPASAAQDMAFDSCNACVTGENQKTGSNNDEQKAPYPGESGSYTAIGCLPTDIPTFLQRYLWTYGLGIAGGIGFLLMLWGAFTILISMGDAKKIEHGRELIISALVGILFIIFSILILRVVGVDILKIPEFS